MTALLHKSLRIVPPTAVDGHGVWLETDDGRRLFDSCGGVIVTGLGYRHQRIESAMRNASSQLAWAHAGTFSNEPAEALAELLVDRSNGTLHSAQFLTSGSEAMEVALKVAYQYHVERKEPRRTTFISRRQSYHGCSISTLAISGNTQRRSVFEPLLGDSVHIAPCYEYRDRSVLETTEQYVSRLALELDETIQRLGAGSVAGLVLEPVVGSTNGAVPAVDGYLLAIQNVCRKHGVLLIIDDIMSGMGRTGYTYSYLEDGVQPDIVVVGKGLAAGYQPISGYLLAQHVHDTLRDGSGTIRNGQTFVNHRFACSIALEVQRTIEDEDLLTACQARGDQLRKALQNTAERSALIGDVRGRGLFLGVELVADKTEKLPLNWGEAGVAMLKSAALDAGLIVYPGHGTIDGEQGAHVLFGPPLNITESEVSDLATRFQLALDSCSAALSRYADTALKHRASNQRTARLKQRVADVSVV